ncbi:MAG: hypothetical protein ACOY0T_35920 [Myxococcota bacterium]
MTLRAVRFQHSAWLAGGFLATAFTALAVGGCSFFYDLNTTQCEVDGDCAAFGPQFVNTQCINRVCVPKQGMGGMTGSGGMPNVTGGVGGGSSEGGAMSQGGTDVGGTAGTAGMSGGGGMENPPECTTNGDCIDAHLEQPYLCREGKCLAVTNDDCPVLLPSRNTLDLLRAKSPILLGGFASMANAQAPAETLAVINWDLAFDELNDKTLGGLPVGSGGELRPVLGLICQGKTTDVTPAMGHLTGNIKVPAILSTLSPDNLNDAWLYTRTPDYMAAGAQPVFFMSTGSADLRLANLKDDGLVWHMLGDPRVLTAPIVALVKRIEPLLQAKRKANYQVTGKDNPDAAGNEPLRVTLVLNDDATMKDIAEVLTTPDSEHPETLLTFNGVSAIDPDNAPYFRRVTIESARLHTQPNVAPALESLTNEPPHLVIAIATSEFPQMVVPNTETTWGKAGSASEGWMRPYYVMSHFIYNTTQLQTVAAQFSSQTPPLNMRTLGVNYALAQDPQAKALYQSYLSRLRASYQGALSDSLDGTENYYDGAYSLFYALTAAAAARSNPAGGDIREGLTERVFSTSSSAVKVDIGPTNIAGTVSKLTGDFLYRMSLFGTMGAPNFDRLSGTRISATSAWCVQKVNNAWVYQADGLLYDPVTRTFSAPSGGTPACLAEY